MFSSQWSPTEPIVQVETQQLVASESGTTPREGSLKVGTVGTACKDQRAEAIRSDVAAQHKVVIQAVLLWGNQSGRFRSKQRLLPRYGTGFQCVSFIQPLGANITRYLNELHGIAERAKELCGPQRATDR